VSDTRVTAEPDRLPLPVALDAERAVLAAMLMDSSGETARKAAALLRNTMFWQANHRMLFDAILRVVARGDDPDLVTVSAELKARNEMDTFGGPLELSRVLDYATWGRSPEQHARIVREHYVRRLAGKAADRLSEDTRTGATPVGEALERFRADTEAIGAEAIGVDEMANAALAGPDFMAEPFTQPRSLMGASMLCEGGGAIIHAPAGEGKSFMGEQFAYAVASGGLWLGSFAAVEKGVPVVLIQAELSSYHVQQRRASHPVYRECPPSLFTLTYDRLGRYIDIIDPADIAKIVRLIQRTKARLIVIDPLSQFHSEAETPEGFARVRRAVQTIGLTTGAAVLLVHHEVKTGGDPKAVRTSGDKARGAGILTRDWAEMGANIEKDASGHYRLHFSKCRHCAKPHDVYMTQDEAGWWNATEAPVPAGDRVLGYVETYLRNSGDNGATYEDLERAASVGRNPVRTALERLAVKSGLSSWRDLNRGTVQRPKFVLPAMSCESHSCEAHSNEEIEW
jgi:hypothetical protein